MEYNYNRKHQEYQLEIHKYPLAIFKDNCFRLSPKNDYYDETITLNEIKIEDENLICVYIDNFDEEDDYITKLIEFRKKQLAHKAEIISLEGSYLTRLQSDFSWDGNKIANHEYRSSWHRLCRPEHRHIVGTTQSRDRCGRDS